MELTNDLIAERVIEALERTAFVLAEPVDPSEAAECRFAPTLASVVGFTGAADGDVVLTADDGFLRELASSMLGVEPEEVDLASTGRDALNELANIVGGSIIIELGGVERDYSYGLPRAVAPAEAAAAAPSGASCLVRSEQGLIRVAWTPNGTLGTTAA